ncbi:MAG: pseudouridine synthase [Pseudomonadota bacterium]
MMIRLQKFLSQSGVCSRRRGEICILEGRVFVNGEKVLQPGISIDPLKDTVTVDGRPVTHTPDRDHIYIALNKPRGFVSSCAHPGEKIVLDLVAIDRRVYPVGRLDKDSTGLLLLTDDGDLHNLLSHPSHDHEKEYVVHTVRPVSDRALQDMARGIVLDGRKTRQAVVKRLAENSFSIVLKQGINRQIRRMVEECKNRVKYLKRIRMGSVILGNLPEGKWRYLSREEVERLCAGSKD